MKQESPGFGRGGEVNRALLTAATIGTLTGVALTFGLHGAVGIAVCAAGVIAWYLVRAVWRDRRRARDRARHPSVRYWTADWQEISGPGFNLKPWPIGDDEVRR